MTRFLLSILVLTLVILVVSCSQSSNDDAIDTEELSLAPVQPPNSDGSDVNPNRDYYDLIVMDTDRWEICLDVNRARQHVISYQGHLWYQSGRFEFEGSCTAIWDVDNEIFTVTALDSGWDRGHILYSYVFEEDEGVDMIGSFVYFEYPRRTNQIGGWLVKGRLGDREARYDAPPMRASAKTKLKTFDMFDD